MQFKCNALLSLKQLPLPTETFKNNFILYTCRELDTIDNSNIIHIKVFVCDCPHNKVSVKLSHLFVSIISAIKQQTDKKQFLKMIHQIAFPFTRIKILHKHITWKKFFFLFSDVYIIWIDISRIIKLSWYDCFFPQQFAKL